MNILGVLGLLCFALAAAVVLAVLLVLGTFETLANRAADRSFSRRPSKPTAPVRSVCVRRSGDEK